MSSPSSSLAGGWSERPGRKCNAIALRREVDIEDHRSSSLRLRAVARREVGIGDHRSSSLRLRAVARREVGIGDHRSSSLSSRIAMAREWTDLFISDTISSRGDGDDGAAQAPERKRRFFSRLRSNLSKTREALGAEVKATLLEGDVDEETWERLEEALIMADVGASTTARVVGELEQEASGGDLVGGEALSRRLEEMLAAIARTGDDRIDLRASPTVIMAVGVNGTGKTTTIGKLAWHLQRELGLKVVLGAADTFRAAAVAQLEGWAERAGSEIVTGREGSDPGAVAFEAIKQGRERGADVVIIDTAGRLHTQDNLMAELTKVRRVIGKQIEGAPHETLLTVDATTGQNGLRQAKLFSEAVPVDGIVLTKLDGTAKGGIALAIAGELGIPVKLIGIGEALEDLRPFDADDYARALLT
jgi:fused signal recognition particle receptor